MPEENFEQQARRKAGEFGMEPKPEVWQRVEAAIAPQKRRRRVLLWWWLLSLSLTGAVVAWLVINHTLSSDTLVSAAVVNDNMSLNQKDSFSAFKQKKKEVEKVSTPGEKTNSRQEEKKVEKATENRADRETTDQLISKIEKRHLPLALESKRNRWVVNNTDIVADTAIGLVKEIEDRKDVIDKADILMKDRNGDLLSVFSSDSISKSNEWKPDTTWVATTDILLTKKTEDENTKEKRKTQKKSWHTGVMAEIGLTSWGKDLLQSDGVTQNAYNADLASGNLATRDSILNNTLAFQQTKNGVAAALGFVVRKDIQKHFYISGQLGYRYHQYTVYNLRSPVIPQPAMTTAYFVNKDHYHTHFLNVTVSAGRHLLLRKRNSLSAEAGIDNSFLFIMNQQNAQQSPVFSLAKSLDAGNFYRWQPHLVVSLPFGWHSADKVRFLVSPFARIGLHTFQKNGTGYKNNHIVSAGVQAVYFFK